MTQLQRRLWPWRHCFLELKSNEVYGLIGLRIGSNGGIRWTYLFAYARRNRVLHFDRFFMVEYCSVQHWLWWLHSRENLFWFVFDIARTKAILTSSQPKWKRNFVGLSLCYVVIFFCCSVIFPAKTWDLRRKYKWSTNMPDNNTVSMETVIQNTMTGLPENGNGSLLSMYQTLKTSFFLKHTHQNWSERAITMFLD